MQAAGLDPVRSPFTGNVPEFDILAVNDKYKTTPIQVKAIRGGDWQHNAARFLDISITPDGVQKIKGSVGFLTLI